MKWIISLLICWSASAQLPVIPYQVPLLSGVDLTGVIHRYVSSDLATNTAVNIDWTDRIQGVSFSWTNGATSQQPTNGAQFGIWTDSTHWLTNFGITDMGSNISFGFIINIVDCGFFSSLTRPSFFGNGEATGTKTFRIGFDSNNAYWLETVGDGTPEWSFALAPWRATNTLVDVIWDQTVTNNDTYGIKMYTNGVSYGPANGVQQNDGKYVGSLNTAFFLPNGVFIMGHDNLRVNGPKMYWKEIWCWTNSPPGAAQGNSLSAAHVANFHKYATNTYGFSP